MSRLQFRCMPRRPSVRRKRCPTLSFERVVVVYADAFARYTSTISVFEDLRTTIYFLWWMEMVAFDSIRTGL